MKLVRTAGLAGFLTIILAGTALAAQAPVKFRIGRRVGSPTRRFVVPESRGGAHRAHD